MWPRFPAKVSGHAIIFEFRTQLRRLNWTAGCSECGSFSRHYEPQLPGSAVPALLGLVLRSIPQFVCCQMTDLYPLLMSPVFDPRPWGTLDLSPIYPNHRFEEKIGESWLTGDAGKVANGPLRGQSLAELSAQYGRDLVGEAAHDSSRFPLLTKFLFPHE